MCVTVLAGNITSPRSVFADVFLRVFRRLSVQAFANKNRPSRMQKLRALTAGVRFSIGVLTSANNVGVKPTCLRMA